MNLKVFSERTRLKQLWLLPVWLTVFGKWNHFKLLLKAILGLICIYRIFNILTFPSIFDGLNLNNRLLFITFSIFSYYKKEFLKKLEEKMPEIPDVDTAISDLQATNVEESVQNVSIIW